MSNPSNQQNQSPCTYAIYYAGGPLEAVSSHLLRAAVQSSNPMFIITQQWNPQQVRQIWQARTVCVRHVTISKLTDLFETSEKIAVNFAKALTGEREYFLTVAVDNDSENIAEMEANLQSEFNKNTDAILHTLWFTHHWSVLLMSLNADQSMIFNVQVYCTSYKFACLKKVERLDPVDLNILTAGFRNGRAIVDYNGWPIYASRNVFIPAAVDWKTISSLRLSDIYLGIPDKNPVLPVLRILVEVSLLLNGTMKIADPPWSDEPLTYLGVGYYARIPTNASLVVFGNEGINFLYCVQAGNFIWNRSHKILSPLDLYVWVGLLVCGGAVLAFFFVVTKKFHWFHLMTTIVGQGEIIRGKVFLVSLVWITACALLGSLYTGIIQGELIKPIEEESIKDFRSLYEAGYEIIVPENSFAASTLTDESKLLSGGTLYLYGMENFLKVAGKDYSDVAFWNAALDGVDTATIRATREAPLLAELLEKHLSREKCHQGKQDLMLLYFGWIIYSPQYAAFLRTAIFGRLHDAGIIELLLQSCNSLSKNS